MSPRAADEGVRLALIESGARLLAEGGPEALTTRRLASEVGTSTMAVYTHFEGLDGLRRAVVLEWFHRLFERVARVPRTTDPVADLGAVGWAYFSSAIENEHMFRAMFVDPLDDPAVAAVGFNALQVLVDAVQRCIDEGRLDPSDASERALQIWMMGTGVIVAHFARLITVDDAVRHFYDTAANLLTTFGDDPDSARRSIDRGRRRMERKR